MKGKSKCDMREMKPPPFHTSPEITSVRRKYTIFSTVLNLAIFFSSVKNIIILSDLEPCLKYEIFLHLRALFGLSCGKDVASLL